MRSRLALLALGLAACGGDGTLVLSVRTDLSPGWELDSVTVVIDDADAGRVVSAGDHRDWGAGVRVVETTLSPGTHRARVTARDASGRIVVERPVRFEIASGALRAVTVFLTRDCAGIACPDPGGDPARTACLAGRCVEERCVEEGAAGCGDPACATAADCGPALPGACAARECTASGACVERLDHAMCGAAEVCSIAGCGPAGALSLPGGGHAFVSGVARGSRLFRVSLAGEGAIQEVTPLLDPRFAPDDPYDDASPALSRDGEWMALVTRRGGEIDAILVAPVRDLGAAELVTGVEAHPYFGIVINDAGDRVVFTNRALELRVLRREAGGWALAPERLDASSPYAHGIYATLRADQSTVLFTCGDAEWPADDAGFCEVGIDGTGFRVVAAPGFLGPDTLVGGAVPLADGSIVFQGELTAGDPEIFRLPSTGPPAVPFGPPEHENPCGLPDGRVLTRWGLSLAFLRPDGTEERELPVELPDAHTPVFLSACGL